MHSYSTYIVGSYKPDLRNFRYALDRLDEDFDISPDQVIVVANSKFHDISPYVDPFLFYFYFSSYLITIFTSMGRLAKSKLIPHFFSLLFVRGFGEHKQSTPNGSQSSMDKPPRSDHGCSRV